MEEIQKTEELESSVSIISTDPDDLSKGEDYTNKIRMKHFGQVWFTFPIESWFGNKIFGVHRDTPGHYFTIEKEFGFNGRPTITINKALYSFGMIPEKIDPWKITISASRNEPPLLTHLEPLDLREFLGDGAGLAAFALTNLSQDFALVIGGYSF